MGGVPYKSKGCNTCRRRKVKCDETKPECERCVKNGHACDGYERNRVFILNSSRDTKALVHRSRGPAPRAKAAKGPTAGPDDVDPGIPRFDVNPEVRTQFVANFIDCFAPAPVVHDGEGSVVMHLQDTFPIFIGRGPVLDKAVTALSSAFLAKQNQDLNLLQYSMRLYGEALKTIHGRIRAGRKCGQESLFSTVIFQLYELINSSPLGFSAWLAHVQGSNAILAKYDNPSPASVTEHLFCRQLKFVTVCDAIGMRKSAYSYSLFWQNPPMENPWQEPVDVILDSILECSALMEQVDKLMEIGNPNLQDDLRTGQHLLDSCLLLRDHLDNGFSGMQEHLGNPWSSPYQSSYWSELDPSIPQDIFPDAIEYPSLNCAESHLLYWTTFILLYPLIDQLLVFLNRPRDNTSFILWDVPSSHAAAPSYATWASEIPEDLLEVAEHYADLICRSAKFLVQPETKAMGAQILLAPFSQATQFFHIQEATEKHRWCQAVFMLLPRLGFGIAPFLKDMIWPKYEAATGKKLSSTSPETASDESSP